MMKRETKDLFDMNILALHEEYDTEAGTHTITVTFDAKSMTNEAERALRAARQRWLFSAILDAWDTPEEDEAWKDL